MQPTDRTWAMTRALLARVVAEGDPRVAALAHLGAAILLFQACDAPMAEALLQAVEWLGDCGPDVQGALREWLSQ